MGRIGRLRLAILASAALAGVVALMVQYLLFARALPPSGEYFLTELARGQIGPVSIMLALVMAFALGFYTQAPPVPLGLSMIAVFPMIALYEGTRFRGSHNLIPFELVIDALWGVPLMIAALLGRATARNSGRQGVWPERHAA